MPETPSSLLIDIHIGRQIRAARVLKGMSRQRLAEILSLTFVEVRGFESGSNRVGVSHLFALSIVLDVSLAWFFENAPIPLSAATGDAIPGPDGFADFSLDDSLPAETAVLRSEMTVLLRAYSKIDGVEVRHKVLDLVLSLTTRNFGDKDEAGKFNNRSASLNDRSADVVVERRA